MAESYGMTTCLYTERGRSVCMSVVPVRYSTEEE